MDKLIITAAICGAEVTKAQNPAVPYTVLEIAEEAYRSYRSGASIIHLHVRNDDGTPTQDINRYKECIDAIKHRCPDVIVQPSTGGAVGMSNEERLSPLDLHPEMATLDCGTINFGGSEIFANSEKTVIEFAEAMYSKGIMPELEVFDKGMVDFTLRLRRKGILKGHLHFNFVMGTACGISATPRDLLYLAESIPNEASFTASGIGRYQLDMNLQSILLGGHVRVGFEDNVFLSKGFPAGSNADFVDRISRISKAMNRDIATPDEARRILHMK